MAGYVIKQHAEDNRKNLLLYPTEKVQTVYKNIIDEENVRVDLCFEGFTEEEKEQALQYLERMRKNIENYK